MLLKKDFKMALTKDQRKEMYRMHRKGISNADIARKYNVSNITVTNIKKKDKWETRNLEDEITEKAALVEAIEKEVTIKVEDHLSTMKQIINKVAVSILSSDKKMFNMNDLKTAFEIYHHICGLPTIGDKGSKTNLQVNINNQSQTLPQTSGIGESILKLSSRQRTEILKMMNNPEPEVSCIIEGESVETGEV